jgi:hypothetical protein
MEFMLTTIDNPFNPFNNYDEWYAFDVAHQYNTCAYLARITKSSDELSDSDELIAIEEAMNEIVNLNITGKYIKVKEDYVPRIIML